MRRAVGPGSVQAPVARGGVDLASLRQRKHGRVAVNTLHAVVSSAPASAARPLQSHRETALLLWDGKERDKNKEVRGNRRRWAGKKKVLRGTSVNEVPGMTQASNEAWVENLRRTSSDGDAGENGFIQVSASIHPSIIRRKQ